MGASLLSLMHVMTRGRSLSAASHPYMSQHAAETPSPAPAAAAAVRGHVYLLPSARSSEFLQALVAKDRKQAVDLEDALRPWTPADHLVPTNGDVLT